MTATWIPRQKVGYAFYERIKRLLPDWLRRLWPERPISIQEVPGPRLNVDKLVDLIYPFLYEPIVALWFVDEPTEYHALFLATPSNMATDKATMKFLEIPMYLFLSAGYTKDEMARCPAFCHEPGLWLEMEDGNHRKLEGWRDK